MPHSQASSGASCWCAQLASSANHRPALLLVNHREQGETVSSATDIPRTPADDRLDQVRNDHLTAQVPEKAHLRPPPARAPARTRARVRPESRPGCESAPALRSAPRPPFVRVFGFPSDPPLNFCNRSVLPRLLSVRGGKGSLAGWRTREVLCFSTREGPRGAAELGGVERVEAEAIYEAGRERCVEFIVELAGRCEELAGRCERLEERVRRLEEQTRSSSRNSSKPPSSDPPKTRQQRRAEARAEAKELLRRAG